MMIYPDNDNGIPAERQFEPTEDEISLCTPNAVRQVSPRFIARVVGHIVVEQPEDEAFYRTDIIAGLEATISQVNVATLGLVDNGFLNESEPVTNGRAGRPKIPLHKTTKLRDYAAVVPEWSRSIDFFRIKDRLGKSEDETLAFLVELGTSYLHLGDGIELESGEELS